MLFGIATAAGPSRALICQRNQVKYPFAVAVRWSCNMKLPIFLSRSALPAATLLVLVTACSPQQESSSTDTAATPDVIRGEPIKPLAAASSEIKGEPIQPLARPETNAPVAPASSAEAVAATSPVPGAEPATQPIAAVIRSGDTDYLSVGFDQLASYTFEVSDELLEAKGDAQELTQKTNSQIPDTIRKLSDQSVAVKGYMLPLKVVEGAVTEFLLMRDQSMCCFGTVPKINEWVSVKTIGKGVKPVMDEPVTIFGKLHVGEMRENGYLVGIYRMDGEKLAGPLDL